MMVLFLAYCLFYMLYLLYDKIIVQQKKYKIMVDLREREVICLEKSNENNNIFEMNYIAYNKLTVKYNYLVDRLREVESVPESEVITSLRDELMSQGLLIDELRQNKAVLKQKLAESLKINKTLSEELKKAKKRIVKHIMEHDAVVIEMDIEKYEEIAEFEKGNCKLADTTL